MVPDRRLLLSARTALLAVCAGAPAIALALGACFGDDTPHAPPDAGAFDAPSFDQTLPDTSLPEAASDAPADAPVDAGSDGYDGGPIVLANDVPNANYIATDGTYVYWVDWAQDDAAPEDGRVMKMSVSGGAEIALAKTAPAQGAPAKFVIDGTNAYWTFPYPTDLWSTPLDGGASVQLNGGDVTFATLAQDKDYLYWPQWPITYDDVTRTPKDGGTSQALTGQNLFGGGPAYSAMVATQGKVFWIGTCCDSVFYVASDGGAPQTLFAGDAGQGQYAVSVATLATDGTYLFWPTSASGAWPARIMKAPLDGGAPTALVDAGTQGTVGSVVTDGVNVYYVDTTNTPSALMKVPVGGGTPVTMTTAHAPTSITIGGRSNGPMMALDSAWIYWLNTFGASEIVKMPK